MDRSDCAELNYIVPIANLPSILDLGILSHNRVAEIEHKSVAMVEIQEIRSSVKLPNDQDLHDYANLYFNARNAMLYKVISESSHRDLAVLRIDSAVLDHPGVIASDTNAARNMVRFGTPNEIVPLLDRDRLFARSWDHANLVMKYRHKGEMCAEVLIPHSVPTEYLIGISVSCEATKSVVSQLCDTLPVIVNEYQFFQGESR